MINVQQVKTTKVWVTTSFVGFHCWPAAPKEVAYLRNLHRHLFGVKVTINVNHQDRDIEYHMLKAEVEKLVTELKQRLEVSPHFSCERMADYLATALASFKYYGKESTIEVEVDEDGECGSIVLIDSVIALADKS